MGRFLVTSALPYANGPIHFGHVVGAYLPADVYVRYLRMKGEEVMFVCGTDEHGIAITINAEKEKIPYRQFVDRWHGEIKKTFDRFKIQFDVFSGTARNPHHADFSRHFFRRLLANGFILKKTEKQWYCPKDELFLADRYVEGICPRCGAEEARGDECKKCGQWLDALELKDTRCTICGTRPEIRPTTHWYLDLPKLHREKIGAWFEDAPKRGMDWKSNVKVFVGNMLKDLRERAITRDMKWGVELPKDLEGGEGKVLYVWFDAPIGYISNTQLLCQQDPQRWGTLENWWKNPQTRLVHFIGKDNIPFHCIVFPSMLFGVKEDYVLPWSVPANEFYNLQGGKFSTSGGWHIDLEDFFSKYSPDAARYTLIATAPETADSEFTWEEFQRRNNGDLADTIGNLASRTLKFIEQKFNGIAPRETYDSPEEEKRFLQNQMECIQKIETSVEKFQFRQAAQALIQLATLGNQNFDEKKPWASIKSDPERCQRDLGRILGVLWRIAIVSRPFMPDTAERLIHMLGLKIDWEKPGIWEESKNKIPIENLHRIGTPQILFAKIEDEQIEKETKNLLVRAQGRKPMMKTEETPPETIAFEDFSKVKLQVGKILSAEPVPKANKLLKLEVDLGKEKRQVLAGIAQQYGPDSLVGKSVIVVTNLAPRTMMGLESQGMVLAATGENGPVLLHPEKDVPPGTAVR